MMKGTIVGEGGKLGFVVRKNNLFAGNEAKEAIN